MRNHALILLHSLLTTKQNNVIIKTETREMEWTPEDANTQGTIFKEQNRNK